MNLYMKFPTVLTMMHNKQFHQSQGNFLLGNLRQMAANPLQAFYDWYRDYGDLVSFRLATTGGFIQYIKSTLNKP